MLVESNPMLDAPSFEREREVRKHIGDYTLFLTGIFPEYVATLAASDARLQPHGIAGENLQSADSAANPVE
jgi:hypothetical protein